MNLVDLFFESLQHTNDIVDHIKPADWHNDTPCGEWDLLKLLNHLTYEWLWAPELFAGKTIGEVGNKFDGDVLGDDPIKSYQTAAIAVESAVKEVDLDKKVHLSYGDVPANEYLFQLCVEALIHGWDVAKSINYGSHLPTKATQTLYELSQKHMADINSTDLYGSRLQTAKNADVQTKLLAIFGRVS